MADDAVPARPARRPTNWQADVDGVAPTILLLGGFLTSPPFYRPLRARLLRRGVAGVVTANVWTPDWLLASVRGLGPIVGRAARAADNAADLARQSPASRGAPLLVIGHSAGGIVARLLTAEQPFAGRRYALAAAFGAIVTLGTPHHVAPTRFAGRRIGAIAARFADRHVPGATFAPRTGYVTVVSRAVVGRPMGTGRERVGFRLYQGLLHEKGATEIDGDGLVPVASALLDGADQVVVDGLAHGQAAGHPWYGTDLGLDQWWPQALDAWRAALRTRAAESADNGRNEAERRRPASSRIPSEGSCRGS